MKGEAEVGKGFLSSIILWVLPRPLRVGWGWGWKVVLGWVPLHTQKERYIIFRPGNLN